MPSRLINSIEYVAGGYMCTGTDEKGEYQARDDIEPDSADYFTWLDTLPSFHFQGKQGHFTARKETKQRGKQGYYYAYRKHQKKDYRRYLGQAKDVTISRLEHIASEIEQEVLRSPQIEKGKRKPIQEPKAVLRYKISEKDKRIAELQSRVDELEKEVMDLKVERAKWIARGR